MTQAVPHHYVVCVLRSLPFWVGLRAGVRWVDLTLFVSILSGLMFFDHGASACVTRQYISICPYPLVLRRGQNIGLINFTCSLGNIVGTQLRLIELAILKNSTEPDTIAILYASSPPEYEISKLPEYRHRSELGGTSSSLVFTLTAATFEDLELKYMCTIVYSDRQSYRRYSDALQVGAVPDPRPITLTVPDIVTDPLQLTCSAIIGLTVPGYPRGSWNFEVFDEGSWSAAPVSGGFSGQSQTEGHFISSSTTRTVPLDSVRGCSRRFRCYVVHRGASFVQYAAERHVSIPPGTGSCPASTNDGDSQGDTGQDGGQDSRGDTGQDGGQKKKAPDGGDSDNENAGDGTGDETDGNDDSKTSTSKWINKLYIGLAVVAILVVAGLLAVLIAYLRRKTGNGSGTGRPHYPAGERIDIVLDPRSTRGPEPSPVYSMPGRQHFYDDSQYSLGASSYTAEDSSMSTSYVLENTPSSVTGSRRLYF